MYDDRWLSLQGRTRHYSLNEQCSWLFAWVLPASSGGMRAHSYFRAIAAWAWAWATCACCLQCAPGCLQLQAISDAGGGAVLHSQSCTSISSESSTPALSLLLNATWTAAPTTPPLPLPVLDLCNQVQSVWLMQGRLGMGVCGGRRVLLLKMLHRGDAFPWRRTGSHLLVEGLLLRNAVLPSWQLVESGLALPAPLAFNLSSGNTSLLLLNCTVSTTCDNLAQFAVWVGQQPSVNATQVWGCHHIHHTKRIH